MASWCVEVGWGEESGDRKENPNHPVNNQETMECGWQVAALLSPPHRCPELIPVPLLRHLSVARFLHKVTA